MSTNTPPRAGGVQNAEGSARISQYLVLQLTRGLQVLPRQHIVHEVHIWGHLQERSLRSDTGEARQELLQIFHDFRPVQSHLQTGKLAMMWRATPIDPVHSASLHKKTSYCSRKWSWRVAKRPFGFHLFLLSLQVEICQN